MVKERQRRFGGSGVDVHNEGCLDRYVWYPGPVVCRYTFKIMLGSVAGYGPCTR